jgi:hypothetical protein
MADYWGGNGRRWDDDAGCLFAHYGPLTTLRDIIDQLVDDYNSGGDCDSFPSSVSSNNVRAALLAMLTDKGRTDYASNARSEFALAYVEANGNEDEDEDDMGEFPVVIVLLEYSPDETE